MMKISATEVKGIEEHFERCFGSVINEKVRSLILQERFLSAGNDFENAMNLEEFRQKYNYPKRLEST